jgi:hypothetical protein
LELAGYEGAKRVRDREYAISFEDAIRQIFAS